MKKKILNNHKFHIVTPSPWPILSSLSLGTMALGMIMWLNSNSLYFLTLGISSLYFCMYQWWRDTSRESHIQGCHSKPVQNGIIMGMILFIISEVMFFASIFWTLLHLSSFPSIECGELWPPMGISMFNPLSLPLLNTLILISSGFFVSWSQYSMFVSNYKMMKKTLMITIILGLLFSSIQLYEYKSAYFSMSDSIYGSVFFFATGFHGIHVIVGTSMLIISLAMMYTSQFSKIHMTFFNFTSWYWHFVDVVWIFLYISLYWWPWN